MHFMRTTGEIPSNKHSLVHTFELIFRPATMEDKLQLPYTVATISEVIPCEHLRKVSFY